MKKDTKNTLTKSPKQADIVMLSVYLLGGESKSLDTEDIAIKCHELAPDLFSWQKYPEQINLEIVRVCLSNAKKKSHGYLLSGSGREGWRLTSNGLDWISKHGKQLLDSSKFDLDLSRHSAGSIDTVRKKREKQRILNSPAWKTWKEERESSLSDAKKVFRIDDYATEKMQEIKIVRIRSMFEDDEEVGPFVRYIADLLTNQEVNNEPQ